MVMFDVKGAKGHRAAQTHVGKLCMSNTCKELWLTTQAPRRSRLTAPHALEQWPPAGTLPRWPAFRAASR